ncbi:MAG: serine hydrolase domain-containing protein [Marinoscillum sp.]
MAISLAVLPACEQNEMFVEDYYDCGFTYADSSAIHPNAAAYQTILDRNRKLGIVGATMMIKDAHGTWVGASGMADIASDVEVNPCNTFLIASISKVFTATVVFKLVDEGLLSLNDPVNKWIEHSITDRIENVNESTIAHLLAHTSGIPDYYTLQFELDRINRIDNDWQQEDVLKYTYGKKATHAVGETYYYSNTNFLLLGMIIESATGNTLAKAYDTRVFTPAGLASAYYDTEVPIPSGTVKGYVDIYGNDQYVESEFLYKDELNTADGGIAINAYDLGLFFEQLMKGELISAQSMQDMTNWFDLPEGWEDEDFGHFQNGLGLEHNRTPYGNSVGHTGGIDGFLSIAQYFPEQDATFVLLVNSGSYVNLPRLNIYRESLEVMFK